MLWRKAVFIVLVILCLSPLGSPQLAVFLGLALGLTIGNPFASVNDKTRELLLEGSIVLLAFGTDLASVYRAFKQGRFFVVAAFCVFVLLVYLLGRVLPSSRPPIIYANAENGFANSENDTTKTSSAAIIVSSIALFVLPIIGRHFNLNADQYGFLSAMSIPGPSFVAGSAAVFKPDSINIAIPLALTATLLIAAFALISRQIGPKETELRSSVRFPWFVLFFVLAVAARTYAPVSIFPSIFDSIVNLGNAGIVVGLFFLAAGISRSDIKGTDIRQFVQIFLPWLLVSAASFWAVLHLL